MCELTLPNFTTAIQSGNKTTQSQTHKLRLQKLQGQLPIEMCLMFPFQYLTTELHSSIPPKSSYHSPLLEPEGHKCGLAIKLGEAYQTEWSQLTVEDWMTIHLRLSLLTFHLHSQTLLFTLEWLLTDKCPTEKSEQKKQKKTTTKCQ